MSHKLVLFRKDCFMCNYKMVIVEVNPCKECVLMTDQGDKFPKWEAI